MYFGLSNDPKAVTPCTLRNGQKGKQETPRTQNGPWILHESLDGPSRGCRPILGILKTNQGVKGEGHLDEPLNDSW